MISDKKTQTFTINWSSLRWGHSHFQNTIIMWKCGMWISSTSIASIHMNDWILTLELHPASSGSSSELNCGGIHLPKMLLQSRAFLEWPCAPALPTSSTVSLSSCALAQQQKIGSSLFTSWSGSRRLLHRMFFDNPPVRSWFMTCIKVLTELPNRSR